MINRNVIAGRVPDAIRLTQKAGLGLQVTGDKLECLVSHLGSNYSHSLCLIQCVSS